MKKVVLGVLLLLILSSCRSVQPAKPPALQTEFSAPVQVTDGKNVLGGTLNAEISSVRLEIQYPSTVSGLIYIYNGAELTVSYGELTDTVVGSALPNSSVVRMLFEDLRLCRMNPTASESQKTDNGWAFLCGSEQPFTVETDDNGKIFVLSHPQIGMKIEFYEE